jgi:UDP-N-acetylmuramyl tripeptide synthase
VLEGDSVIDSAGTVRELALSLPGRANRSNAVMALAVAGLFGANVDQALPSLRKVVSVAGRYTTVERRGRTLHLLLAKNPAGWLEAFDVLDRVLRGRAVLVSGERRVDLAVRLEADEIPFDLVDGVDAAVNAVPPGGLDVIANYTAFQQIRTMLGRTA